MCCKEQDALEQKVRIPQRVSNAISPDRPCIGHLIFSLRHFKCCFLGTGGAFLLRGQRGHRGQIPIYIGDSHVQMSPDHRPGMLVEKKPWENTEVFFADEWKFYQHSQRLTHTHTLKCKIHSESICV